MNANYSSFNESVIGCNIDAYDRSQVVAAGIAVAAAFQAPLPSSALEDVALHYRLNVATSVGTILSAFNECIVFDFKAAVEAAEAFWRLRYNAALPSSFLYENGKYGFFESFFSVDRFVSQELCDLLSKYKKEVLVITNNARACLEQMAEEANETL